jgi:hypothetical protein
MQAKVTPVNFLFHDSWQLIADRERIPHIHGKISADAQQPLAQPHHIQAPSTSANREILHNGVITPGSGRRLT